MKKDELRIGNYYNQFGNAEKVSWSTLKTLEESTTEQLWCKPIPLTEEWLLKFGFEKQIDYEQQINEYGKLSESNRRRGVGLYLHEGEWFVTFREDVGCGWCELNEIEYVHQLQNLYFALTNEELTYEQQK